MRISDLRHRLPNFLVGGIEQAVEIGEPIKLLTKLGLSKGEFAQLLNNSFPAISSDECFKELDEFLYELVYRGKQDVIDDLIVRNNKVRNDLRLYVLGYRINNISVTDLNHDKLKMYELAEELVPTARAYLQEEIYSDGIIVLLILL